LKNLRALITLYIANTISGIAQGISMLAIPWYFARSENMAVFGIIFLITNCLSLIWMPYAGILVDRYNRKLIMLAMTLTGFVIMGSTALAGHVSGMHMWLAAVAFMYTFFHFNIHYTNLYAFVQEIIEERHYARITSVMEVIHQLTTMLAGAVGAILLEGTLDGRWNVFGIHLQTTWTLAPWKIEEIFALDACTYLLALVFFVALRYVALKERHHEPGSPLTRLRNGWEYLKSHRAILIYGTASFCVFVTIIVIGFYINPLYVFNHLHKSADVFAASEMYYALGAILAGAATLTVFKRWSVPGATIILTMVAAVLYTVQGFTTTVGLFYLAVLAMGLSNAGTRVLRTTYLMHEIPNQVYGRANGIFNMINVFMRVVFIFIFALPFFTTGDHVKYTLLILAVFLVAASGVMWWITPQLKRMPK
jgi:MFS family permease